MGSDKRHSLNDDDVRLPRFSGGWGWFLGEPRVKMRAALIRINKLPARNARKKGSNYASKGFADAIGRQKSPTIWRQSRGWPMSGNGVEDANQRVLGSTPHKCHCPNRASSPSGAQRLHLPANHVRTATHTRSVVLVTGHNDSRMTILS